MFGFKLYELTGLNSHYEAMQLFPSLFVIKGIMLRYQIKYRCTDNPYTQHETTVDFRKRKFIVKTLFTAVAEKRKIKWRNYFSPLNIKIE